MIRRLSVLAAFCAVAFASQATIAAPATSTVLVARVPVSYGDLDIRTPAGHAQLMVRISEAAMQACGGNPVFHTQYRAAPNFVRADFQRCRAEAERGALMALQQRGVMVAENR